MKRQITDLGRIILAITRKSKLIGIFDEISLNIC